MGRNVLQGISCNTPLILSALFEVSSGMFKLLDPVYGADAASKCHGIGMQLTMVKDEVKQNLVNDYLSTIEAPTEIWIGLFRNPITKEFYWIDNEYLGTYNNWHPDEPDEPASEFCVRMQNTLWRTKSCSVNYHVLCMYEETTTSSFSSGLSTSIRFSSIYSSPGTTKQRSSTSATTTNIPAKSTDMESSIRTFPNGETTALFSSGLQTSVRFSSTVSSTGVTRQTSPTLVKTTSSLGSFQTGSFSQTSSTSAERIRTMVSCPVNALTLCECVGENNGSNRNLVPFDYLYKIDKKKTTAYIRKHISVHDGRYSAKLIGYSGLAVLIIFILAIISLDIKPKSPSKQKKTKRNKDIP